jgi:hypothetical protein
MPSLNFYFFVKQSRTLFLTGETHEGVRFLMRWSFCNPKHEYKLLFPQEALQSFEHVKISNKVILVYGRLKAKQLRAMGESSSVIAHWLLKTILEGTSPLKDRGLQLNRGSVKCSRKNESSKRLGAPIKSQKHKVFQKEQVL